MIGRPATTDYWAKLESDADGTPVAWHPLECHLADVAACTWALLTHTVLRARFSVLVGRPLTVTDIGRFTFLAAIHDVGKVNNGFQGQAQPGVTTRGGHVGPLIDALDDSTPATMRAAIIEALRLQELLTWFPDEGVLVEWFLTTIAHHGKAVAPTPQFKVAWWTAQDGRDPVPALARLVRLAASWTPEAFEHAPPFPRSPELQHAFNGLLTLADWLGSDVRFFPFATSHSERFEWAKEQATRALERAGMRVDTARAALGSAELDYSMFAGFDTPNDLQRKCLALPADERPSLVVAESDTGSGKTEAAFARFTRLFQAGLVDGMYFALPTRSAATQMFRRIGEMTKRLFADEAQRPPVVLAVPGYISVDDQEAVRLPGFRVQWPDDGADRWRYRGWAAENTKRYLAGAVVVGTIDQALLSVLQVKHAHLRSTALLRHLLVIDEVHASDAYMTRLSEELLRTHLAANGHAFLMSATLGNSALSRYMRTDRLPTDTACSVAYPCITWRFGREHGQLACEHSGYRKTVHVEESPTADDPASLANAVERAVADGARVLIIRNTVHDCVRTFEALEQSIPLHLLSVGDVRAPHHARFAKVDREALDRAVEDALGKASARRGVVVVATQTVEQSLDIDADVLFTDLCPIDVLLQRIGRVHRHPGRARPAGCSHAKVIVLTPQRGLRDYVRPGQVRGPHGIGTVYEDLVILEATRQRCSGRWTIPDDNRDLVERATHPDRLAELAGELGPEWVAHREHIIGKTAAAGVIASLNVIDRNAPFPSSKCGGGTDERIQTRLGEGDRLVSFAPVPGPFGSKIRELRLPFFLTYNPPSPEEPPEVVTSSHPGGFAFSWGGLAFIYDRLGLRRAN